MQSMEGASAVNKVLQNGKPYSQVSEHNAAVGTKTYNGTAKSPHSGGGIDLGGYRKRDAVARATKAMLTKRPLSAWRRPN